jgi:hypothetical protein
MRKQNPVFLYVLFLFKGLRHKQSRLLVLDGDQKVICPKSSSAVPALVGDFD